MAMADESGQNRRPRKGIIPKLRRFAPMLAGAAWALLVTALIVWLATVTPQGRGLHTPVCLFTYPVALVAIFLPPVMSRLLASLPVLIGYYAVLTHVACRAERGPGWLHLAVALYGLHLASNFAGTLYTAYWYPTPAGAVRTWGDWHGLLELGAQAPARLATLGVLLLGWHGFVWWRLWVGAHRQFRIPG